MGRARLSRALNVNFKVYVSHYMIFIMLNFLPSLFLKCIRDDIHNMNDDSELTKLCKYREVAK